jgi:nucleoside-diphosphate-sugar epimerase
MVRVVPVDPPRGPEVVPAEGPVGRALAARAPLGATVVVAVDSPSPLPVVRRVLARLDGDPPARLVVVSSTLVYGAWPSNPTPLTDDAPIRPNPDYPPAVELGEVERLVADWRDAHPATSVVVLRAAPVAGSWLARELLAAGPRRTLQLLHLDDLVSAVVHAAADASLTGACNVAPRGWLEPGPRPPTLGDRVARFRVRAGRAPTATGIGPWTIHPSVAAADRLRAAGWAPAHPPVATDGHQ